MGERSGADWGAGESLNCPHFPSCSAWWGRRWEGEHGVPALLLQLAEPFILPLQRGESKSKEDKSARPTKDIKMRGKEGRVVGKRGRGREKALRPKQKPKPSRSEETDTHIHTHAGRGHVTVGIQAEELPLYDRKLQGLQALTRS